MTDKRRPVEPVEWVRVLGRGKPNITEDFLVRCDGPGFKGTVSYDWQDNGGQVRWTTAQGLSGGDESYDEGLVSFDESSEGLKLAITEAKKAVAVKLDVRVTSGAASRSSGHGAPRRGRRRS
jgi:hypothetical protein